MNKKLMIIALTIGMMLSCQKKNNSPQSGVWCVYGYQNGKEQKFSCESSEKGAIDKCQQLRNSGVTSTRSVAKSDCSEC